MSAKAVCQLLAQFPTFKKKIQPNRATRSRDNLDPSIFKIRVKNDLKMKMIN